MFTRLDDGGARDDFARTRTCRIFKSGAFPPLIAVLSFFPSPSAIAAYSRSVFSSVAAVMVGVFPRASSQSESRPPCGAFARDALRVAPRETVDLVCDSR